MRPAAPEDGLVPQDRTVCAVGLDARRVRACGNGFEVAGGGKVFVEYGECGGTCRERPQAPDRGNPVARRLPTAV
ncbi:hypothetical protein I3F58_27695 [Streptomyces sp. MUM 203J]|uniref:hypothetical protein n=1 Tax=Streptomyces sp. MUM 203J TaxID=2791990 RepID=UPI001F04852E|nr:hypothetical protein [Streptomyces sp. MUM 203J]MCH0543268.1 hypothetical protein [Streptomyces sp. MUM 203J]